MRSDWNVHPAIPDASALTSEVEHRLTLVLLCWLGFVCWALWLRIRGHALERRHERILREELEAYARLDATLRPGDDPRTLAKRVCRTVSGKSAFRKSALLLRDAEGRLYVAGSAEMDGGTAEVLTSWGERIVAQERSATEASPLPGQHTNAARAAAKCFLLDLSSAEEWLIRPDQRLTLLDLSGRVMLLPLPAPAGTMAGALAVSCAAKSTGWTPSFEEAAAPLEALVRKLALSLQTSALTQRLMRAEKLAGLGQLAGGVAHELNNPLTAVLGFAELIAEGSTEPRVREDAQTIVAEALRMREIIQNLITFWRPAPQADRAVDVGQLVEEVTAACGSLLQQRGVRLVVAAPAKPPMIRGDAERLRLVLEHLLENAAQAVEQARNSSLQEEPLQASGTSPEKIPSGLPGSLSVANVLLPRPEHEPPTIRVTVSEPGTGVAGPVVHLVVSDTGTGFHEPSRVFDPFYTTRQPGEGSGLGLSICYGIVREHGGDISAFNLHPRGAAVVVELPVGEIVSNEAPAKSAANE